MHLCIHSNSDQYFTLVGLFLSAVGSAVGGFIGGFLFFKYREKLEKRSKQPLPIQEYYPGKATKHHEGGLLLPNNVSIKILSDIQ